MPSCGRCAKKGAQCEYDVDPGFSRLASMHRKHDALQGEINQLRDFFGNIGNCPEVEAEEIYRQLRVADKPQDLVHPLGATGLPLTPHRISHTEEAVKALNDLDNSAFASSAIKVPAQPWTPLAGDGLVSELVSAFFTYDHRSRIPFIDQEYFLDDMQAGSIAKARYCSPLLVNAICALRCVSDNACLPGNSLTVRIVVYIQAG